MVFGSPDLPADKPKTDWEKYLERKKANIGFITRGKAFREPSPGEMAQALGLEIESWQKSKGTKNYKIGNEYKIPNRTGWPWNSHLYKGAGINLRATRNFEEPLTGPEVAKAIEAYVNTPMDKDGILKSQGIDVEPYRWREIGLIRAVWSWIIGRKVRRKND